MQYLSLTVMAALTVALASVTAAYTPQEETLQKKDVPQAVLKAFEQAYPMAKMKGLSREREKGKVAYEIESVEGKVHRDVTYNPEGSLISVEESFTFEELPQAVRDAIAKEYPKAKVLQCEKIIKGSSTQFEVVLKSGKAKYEVVFEPDGRIVEKEKF